MASMARVVFADFAVAMTSSSEMNERMVQP
jgi:hypothetical protein